MNPNSQLQIGYCTNVHAGSTLEVVKKNLRDCSWAVKQLVSPNSPLGIGLWFSANCVRELSQPAKLEGLQSQLDQLQLVPFTFNGFPYGDFHQPVVKHKVYQPTWADESRLDYTLQLAEIQSRLLPEGSNGSISTLPLAWPTDGFARLWNPGDVEVVQQSAVNLKKCAAALHQLFEQTGRKIRLAIEPEPGCLIDNCEAATDLFRLFLFDGDSAQQEITHEYLGICHDVCHSAVMFEPQREALAAYAQNDIQVLKVQVSSAIEVVFDSSAANQNENVAGLTPFAEDRYLHQTCAKSGDQVDFFEDLPAAISGARQTGKWRVHYHVPIFLERFARIGTTQAEIATCFEAMREFHPDTTHFEIETYAWNVLPEHIRKESLQSGIAQEIEWFKDLIKKTPVVGRSPNRVL